MFYLLMILTGLSDAAAAVVLRIWANNHRLIFLIIGIIGYGLAGLLFALSMQYRGLAIANILWVGLATVLLTILAVVIFKEGLNLWQIVAMSIIFIGVLLLSYFTK